MKPAAGRIGWSALLHRSRCGAAHQRRGLPCQDCSKSLSLFSADGLPVGLMAVADGHGGKHYWLSDVGSRLACRLAIAIAAEDLAQRRLEEPSPVAHDAIQTWLAEDFATGLVCAWHTAIEADWKQRRLPEAHHGEPFSSHTYGTTLGLVVLTPNWWAHTGLGDWDLVLLSDQHHDRIISQEATQGPQGEATQSLCLPYASQYFIARTAVYPIGNKQNQTIGLVLSTDGIRKSCATDTDHLALSRYLLEEAQSYQSKASGLMHPLDSSLDRISREGCGDDVSVAIACFGTVQTNLSTAASAITIQADHRLAYRRTQQPQKKTKPNCNRSLAAIVVMCGLSIAIFAWLKPLNIRPTEATGPKQSSLEIKPSLKEQNQLNLEAKKLCNRNDSYIKAALSQRKDILKNIAQPRMVNKLLKGKDWLGSLILVSYKGKNAPGEAISVCPKLKDALKNYWQQNSQRPWQAAEPSALANNRKKMPLSRKVDKPLTAKNRAPTP